MDQNLTPEEQAVYQNVIAPAFFHKCAQRGRQLNPAELEVHLENAAMVQHAKQAEESSLAKQANHLLKSHLGFNETVAQTHDASIKTAAAALIAQNPALAQLLS